MNKSLTTCLNCLVLCLGVFCRCGGGGSGAAADPARASAPDFPMVEIPGIVAQPADRLDYMAQHFWDRFSALQGTTDSLHFKGLDADQVEEKFGLWATLLKSASPSALESGVRVATAGFRADSAAFVKYIALADKYFYNANSPVRNEEAYLSFLNSLLEAPLPDEDMRFIYEYQAGQCSLNRPGKPASDFAFVTPEGRQSRLYDIEAPVILLFFSNPGCPLCASYQENLQKNEPLVQKMREGAFKVVNIYPDEDVEAWRTYVQAYPSEWICGRDHLGKLLGGSLYSLRAIPSLYLLDADKTVILKDATYEEIEMKLYDLLFRDK